MDELEKLLGVESKINCVWCGEEGGREDEGSRGSGDQRDLLVWAIADTSRNFSGLTFCAKGEQTGKEVWKVFRRRAVMFNVAHLGRC